MTPATDGPTARGAELRHISELLEDILRPALFATISADMDTAEGYVREAIACCIRRAAIVEHQFAKRDALRAALVRWAAANDAARRAYLLLGMTDREADREYREAADALMRLARADGGDQ
jgi:hypothetical protein